jgi:hypothetical protein
LLIFSNHLKKHQKIIKICPTLYEEKVATLYKKMTTDALRSDIEKILYKSWGSGGGGGGDDPSLTRERRRHDIRRRCGGGRKGLTDEEFQEMLKKLKP